MNIAEIDWTPGTQYLDNNKLLWSVTEEGDELRLVGKKIKIVEFFYSLKTLSELSFTLYVVDWVTLPIDTKVLVSNDEKHWLPRHYAGYFDGDILVWPLGTTSHTAGTVEPEKFNFTTLAVT